MSYTPLANVLKRNLRDLRKYIIRDYNEIEELQSSIKDSKIFIQKSQNKIEAEVINFLTKIGLFDCQSFGSPNLIELVF